MLSQAITKNNQAAVQEARDLVIELGSGNGPVSHSDTARQGAGRVGIGMLFDYGAHDDIYRSLRMSQGAAVFGVGLLYDDGGIDDYDAEAFAQGASLKGLGILWDKAGDDNYRLWHAGQGFGTAAGSGVLQDLGGADTYEAVPGALGGTAVLYYSPTHRGASNRNLAQGASAGVSADTLASGLGGGLGTIRDLSGADNYTAGTYAQGYGSLNGLGHLNDVEGADSYEGKGFVQGAGQLFGGGLFMEEAGADEYNQQAAQDSTILQYGQGGGTLLGWGFFMDNGGDDIVEYMTPGGGVGQEGGFGFAFSVGGIDDHSAGTESSWGFGKNSQASGTTLENALSVGVFIDVGENDDTYTRPNIDTSVIEDAKTWLQPDVSSFDAARGVGVDE